MKTLTYLLLLLPFFSYCEISDSTYIKSVESKIDTSISKNSAQLQLNLFQPNGSISNGKDIVVFLEKDTFCYNEGFSIHDKPMVSAGSHVLTIHSKWWGSVKKTIYFKPQHLVSVDVMFGAIPHSLPNIVHDYNKPVIYLYPEKKQAVEVQLNFKGDLTFTYPTYNSAWNCSASPNGDLNFAGSIYKYLFWEGQSTKQLVNIDMAEGYVVKSDSLLEFFQKTLSQLKFKPSEQQDFITYWCPIMKSNNKNFIHFVFNQDYDSIAELTVIPKPDNVIRVFMFWKVVDAGNNLSVEKQEIPQVSRQGFTVLEWGGGKLIK